MTLCKHVKIESIGGVDHIVLISNYADNGKILDGYSHCPICGLPLRVRDCRRGGFGRFVCPRYWGKRFCQLKKRFRGGRS